ncbi:hypothetical protein FOMCTCXJ_CDS_0012 [Pseudomonas phage Athelas]|nr:hypothetical protein FOMCTCXJ_CDS_0012 [Pseudomonas phage Athelas]
MKIHDLTAELLSLPAVSEASKAVALSKFAMSFKGHSEFRKVHHRELVYTVGHWDGWEGKYWVVEDRTGIIFRHESIRELRECIKLCSASFHEPDEVQP